MKFDPKLNIAGNNVFAHALSEGLTFGQAHDQLLEEYCCHSCGEELTEDNMSFASDTWCKTCVNNKKEDK